MVISAEGKGSTFYFQIPVDVVIPEPKESALPMSLSAEISVMHVPLQLDCTTPDDHSSEPLSPLTSPLITKSFDFSNTNVLVVDVCALDMFDRYLYSQ